MDIYNSDHATFVDEPAQYERRIVAFYDVMGWQSKIERAGTDGARVTTLKNMARLFSATRGAYGSGTEFDGRITTFSDNVVVSAKPGPSSLLTVVMRLAMVQLWAAQIGFLIRGGITIGDIFHDEYVVFGPALNRAYQLEKRAADKPRIVVDLNCMSDFAPLADLINTGEDIPYVDPWTRKFGRLLQVTAKKASAEDELVLVLRYLGHELRELKNDEKNTLRLEWLFKKIVTEISGPIKNLDEAIEAIRAM